MHVNDLGKTLGRQLTLISNCTNQNLQENKKPFGFELRNKAF